MDKGTFVQHIEGIIDYSESAIPPGVRYNDWQVNYRYDGDIEFRKTADNYLKILIHNLRFDGNPPTTNQIEFRDEGNNLSETIPNDIGLYALSRLPYILYPSYMPMIILGVSGAVIGLSAYFNYRR